MSYEQLRKITEDKIERSKISPPKDTSKTAKVVSVYDGDTCDLVVIMGRRFERFKCRLAYIDTPEMPYKKDEKSDPEGFKKALRQAKKSRDFLAWLCMGNDPDDFNRRTKPLDDDELQAQLDENTTLVYVEFQKPGRWGRPIVVLKKDGEEETESFNNLLLEYGYAQEYKKH